MTQEIGINRHAPQEEVNTKWDYKTLANAPAPKPDNEWVTSIYRGLIPAKNIEKRDFAIAGATVWDSYRVAQHGVLILPCSSKYSANFGYSCEVAAHWISSYFQNDKMRLPTSVEEAIAEGETLYAWMKARFPDMLSWVNESQSANLEFWT
jgi:dimethylaniline monooxygenase (N-oxide forming)